MSASPPSTGKRKRPTISTLDPDAVINPLSHSTKTLAQFVPAGHSPNLPIPSTLHPNFPHRPLPRSPSPNRRRRSTTTPSKNPKPKPKPAPTLDPSDGDDEITTSPGSTSPEPTTNPPLTPAPPNRTAQTHHVRVGALTTAIRALLGRNDLPLARRAFGLLVRARVSGGARLDLRRDRMWEVGTEILMRCGEGAGGLGMYYAALAREYPFSRTHPGSVSAVEFYAAGFGVEMEGVWEGMVGGLEGGDAEGGVDRDGEEDGEGEQVRRERVRREALGKMRRLAGRMDDVMDTRPFSADHEMLRLRAMVALFVSDLAVGSGPGEEGEEGDGGVRERAEAIDKARSLLRTLKKTGGEIKEGWIERLIDEDGEDGEVLG